jgi:hypothetical protein
MLRFFVYLVPKTVPSNETLEYCIDLCHNSERCQERLERFFFPSGILIENKFNLLVKKFFQNNLFDIYQVSLNI